MLQCAVAHCSVLQCVTDSFFIEVLVVCMYIYVSVCCSALQCVGVCCSVLQCVAVCCCVLQCVADSSFIDVLVL